MSTSDERRACAAQEAAAWLIRLEAEQLDTAERGQFIDWLRESPLHVAEMLRMGAVHGLLSEFQGWRDITSTDATAVNSKAMNSKVVALPLREEIGQASSPPVLRTSYKYLGLLAASLAIAAVGMLVFTNNGQQHIQTQHGEHREIKLADGSLLEVAPDSELHLRMGRKQRLVTLDRGEALFHVAKDPNRPFIVDAGQTSVRAVGTAFSVDRATNSVTVTVAEGKVAVTVAEAVLNSSARTAPRQLALGAGQQVAIAANGIPAEVHTVNSKTELAWARGLLIFDGNSVAEVVQRFNLSNRLQIKVLDQALAARPVSGVFDAADPQSFVAFLANVAGASVVQNGAEEILVGVSNSENSANNKTSAVVAR